MAAVIELNYHALAVSILVNCIPETAFEKLQSDKPSNVRAQITDSDWSDMVKLREQGVYYKDLEEIYCLDKATIFRKLKSLSKLKN